MHYGFDYDLNVLNMVNASDKSNPIQSMAIVTLYRDISYLDWLVWYQNSLKPELEKLNVRAIEIRRSDAFMYQLKKRDKTVPILYSIKYGLDKNKNICRIIGVNKYTG